MRGEFRVTVTKDYLVFASAHFITFAGLAVADDCPEQVVTVAKHVRLDLNVVAHASLGCVPASVDGRSRILNHDARGQGGGCARLPAGTDARLRARRGTGHIWTLSTRAMGKPRR